MVTSAMPSLFRSPSKTMLVVNVNSDAGLSTLTPEKVMVSVPAAASACRIADARLPAPLLFVLVTMKVAMTVSPCG